MTSCPIHKYTELCNGNHLWYRYINLMVHVLTRFYLIFPKIGITHVSWWAKSNTVVSISSKVQWGYRPVSNSIWDSRTPSTCLGWEWATVRSRAWRPDIGRLDLGSSMWSTSSSTEAGQAELEGCQSQKTQVLHNLHTPVGYNFFSRGILFLFLNLYWKFSHWSILQNLIKMLKVYFCVSFLHIN